MDYPASDASYAMDAANSAQLDALRNERSLEGLRARVESLEYYVDYLAYILSEVGDLALERDVLLEIQERGDAMFPAMAGGETVGYADED